MKHLTLFNTEADYSASELSLPNVSYIVESNVVKYHPFDPYAQPIYLEIPSDLYSSDYYDNPVSYPEVRSKALPFEDYVNSNYSVSNGEIVHCIMVVNDHEGYGKTYKVGHCEVNLSIWIDGEDYPENRTETFEAEGELLDIIKYFSNIYVQQTDGSYLPVQKIGFTVSDINKPILYTEDRCIMLSFGGEVMQY